MMNEYLKFKSFQKTISIFSTCFLLCAASVANAQSTGQSKKTTQINGRTFIVHTVSSKDTYYQLSRIYGIPVNDIMAANNKKNLRVGDTVNIPSVNALVAPTDTVKDPVASNSQVTLGQPTNLPTAKILTEYKVGDNETLYSIARRFATTVDDIKKINGLTSDTLRPGQSLKIPDGKVVDPQPTVESTTSRIPIPEEMSKEEIAFETNRYGIREKKEKGIGMWMSDLESSGKSNLALHRTAPVGTILKITNPLTKSVTFAKVVGKFSNTAESHDAIVILSKSAASHIGALDKRFLIEITYGAPIE
ncbi:DPBB and LysM peptidoglycan-binding domain-containing protein [Sphingobacterium kyonggiense]